MTHHVSSDIFWVISVHIKLESHHFVIVRLQLTLDNTIHFIRKLQRQKESTAITLNIEKHTGEGGGIII